MDMMDKQLGHYKLTLLLPCSILSRFPNANLSELIYKYVDLSKSKFHIYKILLVLRFDFFL
jgi:hypothetical protein